MPYPPGAAQMRRVPVCWDDMYSQSLVLANKTLALGNMGPKQGAQRVSIAGDSRLGYRLTPRILPREGLQV